MSRREEILEKLMAVPALPVAATEVVRTLEDPGASLAKVVRLIEHDPGLTSNLLRLANSAFFSSKQGVGSIREAAMRLGTKWLFHMAVGAAVSPLAQPRVIGYDMPPGELLTHSVAVAVGTEQIARMLNQEVSGYAFTAGLLHDLGKIVLGTFVAVDAAPIKALAFTQNVSFDEAERRVLGIDHAEAGGVLLEHWRLPAQVVEAVRWHHQPENCANGAGAAALVHVADGLCLLAGLGTGSDGANYRPSAQAATKLHMSAADTEKVMFGIMAGLGEWRALLAQVPGRE